MPIKFAAKKVGWSQSDKGFVLRLLVSPDDDWTEAANAPLGSPFGVVMVPIDPETGVRTDASPGSSATSALPTGEQRGEAGKPLSEAHAREGRRRFDELPLSQQAALLCRDERFQKWAGEKGFEPTQEGARVMILNTCGISSRADLERADYDEYPQARQSFAKLNTQYRMATGQMAEQR